MKKLQITLALATAAAAASFPAQSAAHGGDPHNEAKAIEAAMKSPIVVRGSAGLARLTIVHVQRGCHIWSNGKQTAAGVKVLLRRGERLSVLNQDIDTHQLVRVAGPKVALGPALAMNGKTTVRFAKAGVYRLKTEKAAMPGMPEVETMGTDHLLAAIVVVT